MRPARTRSALRGCTTAGLASRPLASRSSAEQIRIERVPTTDGWAGCAAPSSTSGRTRNRRRRRGWPHRYQPPVASGLVSGAVDRKTSGRVSVSVSRLALALGAWLGSQGAARWRVDARVAVIPADPITRRRIATQHFFNHAGAGSAADRLRLGYHALADCKGHSHSRFGSSSRA
jgi:hypothetical protein